MKKLITVFSVLLLVVSNAYATSVEKELRWKQQVVGDLFDGEPITLNDGNLDFLGLITQADEAKPNAILVLHGVGAHPDWPQIVNPLRVELAEQGWTTLSIQLPVLENDATPDEYLPLDAEAAPRILAGVKWLKQAGAQGVYIVAHSMGSRMASYFLAQTQEPIAGFVGVGMNVGTVQYLDKISIPVLDLYGSNDLPGVLNSVQDRANASSGNAKYTSKQTEGADHFFNDMEDELVAAVSAWLAAN